MESGRRSFIGQLLAVATAPMAAVACKLSGMDNRKDRLVVIRVWHGERHGRLAGYEAIFIGGDDIPLRTFSDSLGVELVSGDKFGEYGVWDQFPSKNGAHYCRNPLGHIEVFYRSGDKHAESVIESDIAKSIKLCRSFGAEVIDKRFPDYDFMNPVGYQLA